ncbi:MAG: hydroxyacylglutathione hydrolase [Alphaproteobacteria bacterium]|nr:hydroxyacylglutathione hydrolase [Alphaproteobacteria bacterium]
MQIVRVPAFRDNYLWLLRCAATGTTGVVDPGDAEPVRAALAARGWGLDWILVTHHHWDHVGGVLELKQSHGARVVGAAADADRVPGLDVAVAQDDGFTLGAQQATVHFVPGHTRAHIAYHFADARALFVGDTIFAMGCGRLFEGTPAQLWDAMARLRQLPGDTEVFCAHEYTLSNARFARTVDPDNAALAARAADVQAARDAGRATVPFRLSAEQATNPFMRADDPAIARQVGLAGAPPVQVLGEVRARKDAF